MSGISTPLNVSPFHDDYDETKNFHRILFRPGMAVQARELTQLQSILQTQVSRFGDHVFKEGSLVLGAGVTVNQNAKSVKLNQSFTGLAANYANVYIRGVTSNALAKVITTTEDTGVGYPATLYVRSLNGNSFLNNEVVQNANTLVTIANTYPTSAQGGCTLAGSEDAVYFVRGSFVKAPKQVAVIDKWSANTTALVGFNITESTVTSGDDSTLLDPAAGSYNYTAPGADRLKVTLTLGSRTSNTANFIKCATLESGKVIDLVRYPVYSVLEETLARRTYDESGSYTVRHYPIQFQTNANTSIVTVAVEPGKSFVQGFEKELYATTYLTTTKPRTTSRVSNAVVYTQYGSYCYVTTALTGNFFSTGGNFTSVELHNNATPGAGTKIGTAKVRNLVYEAAPNGDSGNPAYRMYLFDIAWTASADFTSVASIIVGTWSAITAKAVPKTGTSTSFFTDHAKLFGTTTDNMLYQTGGNTLSQVLNDTAVEYIYSTSGSWSASATATFSPFASNSDRWLGTDGVSVTPLTSEYKVVALTTNGSFTAGQYVTAATLTPSASGKTLTVNLGSSYSGSCAVIGPVIRPVMTPKSKTLVSNQTLAVAVPNTTVGLSDALPKSDIYALKSVYLSPDLGTPATTSHTNVTDYYVLDNGQRDSFYDHGAITLKTALPHTGRLLITYDYFTHSSASGDSYFTLGSYVGIDRENIPVYINSSGKQIHLADCLDFRPRRTDGATTFDANLTPIMGQVLSVDYDMYLPRIDTLWVDKNGTFGIATGIPSAKPQPPTLSEQNMMSLWNLRLPAYVLKMSDLKAEFIDNRRYTMRDIGDIARRVDRLEYYVALNNLEKTAADMLVKDAVGNSRFKNGILVDQFTGHSVGNVFDEDYRCSIDPEQKFMTAPFITRNYDFTDSFSVGAVQKTGDIITLPYTETNLVSQTRATRAVNVNPFDVIDWVGSMDIVPPSDNWVDTEQKPDVLVNMTGDNDAWEFLSRTLGAQIAAGWGTQWQDWRTIAGGAGWMTQTRSGSTIGGFGVSTITSSLGNRVTDVSIIPFIRESILVVTAKGMKPNTRVYPFFDGIDVKNYTKQQNNATNFTVPIVSPGSLMTDDAGQITVAFKIPCPQNSNNTLKFRTGERQFRLVDDPTNNLISASTYSNAVYTAQGLLTTKENVNLSIRSFTGHNVTVNENRTLTWRVGGDPTSQTFFVDSNLYPNGIMVSSIELYFRTKSNTLPVTLQIRTTVNGYPSSVVLPLGTSVIDGVSVNTSQDGSVATKFAFPAPVYLAAGVEYAMVVLANTTDYEVFVAEMGGIDLQTGHTVVSQPAVGSLFQSQNSSTWTAEQNLDLTFKINRCLFNTGASGVVSLASPADTIQPMDVVYPNIQDLQVASTGISYKHRAKQYSGLSMDDWADINNTTTEFFTNRKQVESSGDYQIQATLVSSSADVSPMIDTLRMSFVAIENLINNDDAGETSAHGNALARYITRPVTLKEGFDATDLKVILNGYKPYGASIDVYYKVLAGTDGSTFDSRPWVKMFEVNSSANVSDTRDQTFDIEYKSSDTAIPSITYGAFTNFNQFAIKIVLKNANTALAPIVKELRVVALA